jgi:chitin-binding protein
VPAVPGNLQLVTKNATSVTFSWTQSTDNVAVKGYNIYRDEVILGMTDKLSYTDTGLTKDKSYTYTVKAVDTSNNESQAAELKVVPGVPDAPSGFTAVPGIYSIDISWEPVKSEGFSYYKLYSGSESSELTFWMDVKNGTKAVKAGLSCGTTVYFAVSAVDIWGNEGPKTETSATTIVDTVSPQIKLFQPENGTRTSNRYVALRQLDTDNGA